ncbi:MAG: cupin domain-containing protein [Armatimonadetes bacterium]|nr:cupin domain-containing protein [Armatimonadota bacterium]
MPNLSVNENDVPPRQFPDRWSKDLIGTEALPTTSGFSLGRACYTTREFGEPQVHADQEAVYVISGVGEVMIGDEVITIRPGDAFYVGPGVKHCARRTSEAPVQVIYAHGAI